MSSRREQILEAMVSAWNTDTPAGVPQVQRAPFLQRVVDDDTPILADLYWITDEEKADAIGMGPAQMHELLVGLELRGAGSPSALPETVLDPCAVWAVKCWNDNRLGDLAEFLRVGGSQMERETQDRRPIGKLLIGMIVRYVSAVDDFEQ